MILPDVQAVLGLQAFLRHARADHLGQAVDVGGVHREGVLDFGAHRVGPGLCAEDADFERALPGIQPLALELVEDRQHVARRHRDDVGPEIVDQLHLPLGHAAGDRHHGAAEFLGAVMDAKPAGEQAVAIGIVNDHAAAAAGGADRACHHVRPGRDVVSGVADHDRFAGGARGGMHPHQLLARHGEHVERIIVAQVGLHRERKFGEIGELAEIRRMNAGRVEGAAVMRDVVIGVLQRPGEAFCLQRHDLVARGALGGVHVGHVAAGRLMLGRCHGVGSSGRGRGERKLLQVALAVPDGTSAPPMLREWPRNSAITVPAAVTRTS